MPRIASSSPTSPASPFDSFLPPDLPEAEQRRGRMFVGFAMLVVVGFASSLLPLGWMGWTWSFVAVTLAGLTTVATLVGLRRGAWSPEAAAWVVYPVLVVTTLGVAWGDMGLAAPELMWLAFVPIVAALTTSRLLSTVCAIGITLGAVGLAVHEALLPFPQSAPPPLTSGLAMVSLAGVAAAGAILGQIYQRTTDAALTEQRARLVHLTEALRVSETRHRTALQNLPVGVVHSTIDGELLLVNPALARILGYESVEALRASSALATDFYTNLGDRDHLLRALASNGEHVVEVDARNARGQIRRLRIHARARRGTSGSLIGVEAILEDITAEHDAQRQLVAREAHFRALVQHASDVVCVLDRKARLTYASLSIQGALGVAPEDAIGAPVHDLLHPEDASQALALFNAAVQSADGATAEFRLRHVDGHYLFVEAIATPLFDDPAVGGLVVNFREVTDRKRAEAVLVHAKEQAEEVARLKSTFLANMSHEIRTPLTGILGFADILSDEVSDPEQREFVDLILRSGQRLLDTLNSVLDLAKLDAGRMELTSEPIALAEAAQETSRLLAPLAAEKGIVLSAAVEDEDARAEVDLGALNRILTNLVGNAIKFTNEGSVTIAVRGTTQQVMLDVTDTGVGIDADFLPHLFEEFQQESMGHGRSHEGSGLGLAISRQLAERMEGTISVTSEKGVGSTFTVTFPRAEVASVVPGQRQARVLVVDDNDMTSTMAARMLEAVYRVETAHGPETAEAAALNAAKSGDPFDVVLLDINLGTMDTGEDVMRRLRECPPYDTRPIIAFTAYALPGDRERFLSGGFDGYFSKPFTRDTLLEAVANVLRPDSRDDDAPAFIVRNRSAGMARPGERTVLVPGTADE